MERKGIGTGIVKDMGTDPILNFTGELETEFANTII